MIDLFLYDKFKFLSDHFPVITVTFHKITVALSRNTMLASRCYGENITCRSDIFTFSRDHFRVFRFKSFKFKFKFSSHLNLLNIITKLHEGFTLLAEKLHVKTVVVLSYNAIIALSSFFSLASSNLLPNAFDASG